jgi:hypothetical protein
LNSPQPPKDWFVFLLTNNPRIETQLVDFHDSPLTEEDAKSMAHQRNQEDDAYTEKENYYRWVAVHVPSP